MTASASSPTSTFTALPLHSKIALVTGASRGIGKGIAIALAEAGATVYITGRSVNPEDAPLATDGVSGSLRETQDEIAANGGTCIAVPTDHGDDEQVRSLFHRIETEQNGQLDILVNNVYGGVSALRASYGTSFWENEVDLWDACNNVGLRSHYLASIYGARMMVPRQQGLICTISSWGSMSPIFGAAYGAGKTACDRLSFEMARELKPHGVTALSLWPGIVGTEHISQAFANDQGETNETPKQAGNAADMIRDQYNWETPLFTGRVLAALAADPQVQRRTGRVNIVAELARTYGVVDETDQRPVSLRSLRFLLPYAVPSLQTSTRWIPDILVPWWLLLLSNLASPRVTNG